MKAIAFVLPIAICLAAPAAHAADWRPLPASEYAFQALNLADMATSLDIKNHPNIHEANPLLGRHPSDGTVIGVKLASGAIHAAITEWLLQRNASPTTIKIWEYVTIGGEGAVVGHNLSLGLRFTF